MSEKVAISEWPVFSVVGLIVLMMILGASAGPMVKPIEGEACYEGRKWVQHGTADFPHFLCEPIAR